MANIYNATAGEAAVIGERLQSEITAYVNGLANQTYTLNVSHKKHLVSSYKTNDAQPPTAPPNVNTNTVVSADLVTFTTAFTEFTRLLAARIVGTDHATFDPSTVVLNTGKNIAFSTDVHQLGGNVHCYPVVPAPAPHGNRAFAMDNNTFNRFKIATKFLFQPRDGEGIQAGPARQAWQAISGVIQPLVGQPNEMLTNLEITALERRLVNALEARRQAGQAQGMVNQAQQQIQGRPDLNRPPFRNGW